MKRYRVMINWENTSVDYGWVHVEAEDPEAARKAAIEGMNKGNLEWEPDSSVTDGEAYTAHEVEEE